MRRAECSFTMANLSHPWFFSSLKLIKIKMKDLTSIRRFRTTFIFTLDKNIGNRCMIWQSTGPLFWVAKKYINYLSQLKGRFGKISCTFWGTTLGPKMGFDTSEPRSICTHRFKWSIFTTWTYYHLYLWVQLFCSLKGG